MHRGDLATTATEEVPDAVAHLRHGRRGDARGQDDRRGDERDQAHRSLGPSDRNHGGAGRQGGAQRLPCVVVGHR
jgi:hypothetical protein